MLMRTALPNFKSQFALLEMNTALELYIGIKNFSCTLK